MEKWAQAAYGMSFDKLPLTGPDSFNTKLEDWQIQPKCLKSIAGFSLKQQSKRTSLNNQQAGVKYNEWNFQKEPKQSA